MKFLSFIFLILYHLTGQSQSFDIDSCIYYYKGFQDKKLINYLLKHERSTRKEDLIDIHLYKSRYYRDKGDTDGEYRHLTLGYELVKNKYDSKKCDYLDQWAITFRDDESSSKQKGLEYISSSINLKKKLDLDSNSISKSYIIKGNLYFDAEGIVANIDSAKAQFLQAKEYALTSERIIDCLYSLVSASTQKENLNSKEINEVKDQYNEIIAHYQTSGFKKNLVDAKLNLASFCDKQKDTICYNRLMNEAQIVIEKENWLDEKIHFIENKIFNALKSDYNYKQISKWQDSLVSYEKKISSSSLDEQITKFELDNKVAAAEAQLYKNRFWQSILLGTTLTMVLVLIGLYKYLVLKRKTIEDELQHTKTLSDLNATKAKMEGEQKERESIASVLHDQVASLLTAADMHLKVAKKKAPNTHGLTQVSSIIKDINQQVRDLSHQLVSPTLMKFGLEAGIETLTHRMAPEQLNLHFSSNLGERRYDTQVETFIFQSCSELIQNVLKHSTATSCEITLTEKEGSLHLFVIDNGNNEHIDHSHATGLGLTHIYKRAAAMGGGFDFHLRDNGAYSTLTIPAKPIQVEVINHSY